MFVDMIIIQKIIHVECLIHLTLLLFVKVDWSGVGGVFWMMMMLIKILEQELKVV